MPKISVIIPNYNCSQWLPKVVQSCLIQKHLHEIIIIDDHSTDNSWEILIELQKQYQEKIKVFKNPEKGSNNARNFGFSKSSGNYIQWLDADDFLLEGKFENQIKTFEQNSDTDIVYSDWYMDFYEGKIDFLERKNYEYKKYDDFTFELLADNWSANNSYLFKREIVQKLHENNGWNPKTKVAQDREYVAKKLGFNDEEFESLLNLPNIPHEFYGTHEKLKKRYFTFLKIIKPISYIYKRIKK